MKNLIKFVCLMSAALISVSLSGQAMLTAPDKTIEWTVSQENIDGKTGVR